MDRAILLSVGSAIAGLLSFSTLFLRASDGPVAHLAENATWALLAGVVVLALLAVDGARERRAVRVLIGAGVAAAGLRAFALFALGR